MFKTFEMLNKAYGLNNSSKARNDLTIEQERKYVEDCFNTYEKIGFSQHFHSPYDSCSVNNGKKFSVVKRLTEKEVDLECLPMWIVLLETGEQIPAYPEEICFTEKILS